MMAGRIVVVTGASRGLGRGIALALGATGDTVYITGRSDGRSTSQAWPGTVQATAEEVTARGGTGIAVGCDHRDDAQTKALFDRVEAEQGRIDILVNNAFGMREDAAEPGPFWERPLDAWEQMIDVGLRSSYVASYYAVPMMIRTGGGLIVNTSSPGGKAYLHTLPYGIGKVGQDKLAFDMAHELKPHPITVLSFWHGLILTQRTRDHYARHPDVFEMLGGPSKAETPEFAGRLIDAIWQDPNRQSLSGGSYWTAELAAKYGVEDVDGNRPESHRALFGGPIYDAVG